MIEKKIVVGIPDQVSRKENTIGHEELFYSSITK